MRKLFILLTLFTILCGNLFASELHRAIRENNYNKVKSLLTSDNVNQKDGSTLLNEAVLKSNFEIVKLLLENGADPNLKDKHSQTPIFSLRGQNGYKIALLLKKYGADIESRDSYGRTPLLFTAHLYTSNGIFDILKAGANVKAKDSKGKTALHIAAARYPYHKYLDVVKALIEYDANINAREKHLYNVQHTWETQKQLYTF